MIYSLSVECILSTVRGCFSVDLESSENTCGRS